MHMVSLAPSQLSYVIIVCLYTIIIIYTGDMSIFILGGRGGGGGGGRNGQAKALPFAPLAVPAALKE